MTKNLEYTPTKKLPVRASFPISVNVLLFNDRDEVLLFERANTGWADGAYTAPAGHVEEGESFTGAAAREIKEEIGVDVSPEDFALVHVMHRGGKKDDMARVDFYFIAHKWRGEPYLAEPEKSTNLGWFASDAIPDETLPNLKHALRCIKQSEALSERE